MLHAREEDAVLVISLDRPESLNAFTVELHEALAAALERARRPEIPAVAITGAGRRALRRTGPRGGQPTVDDDR